MLPQVELEDERARAAASAQDAKEAQVAVTSLKAAMQLERHKALYCSGVPCIQDVLVIPHSVKSPGPNQSCPRQRLVDAQHNRLLLRTAVSICL